MSDNSIILRPATIADMDEVTRIQESASIYSDIVQGKVPKSGEDSSRWEGWASYFNKISYQVTFDPLLAFQIATQGDSCIGFVVTRTPLQKMIEPTGLIESLYVAPDIWGRGVGKRLLNSASRFLAERGCRWGILWTEYNNKVSEPFYQSQGWTRCEGSLIRHTQYTNEGFILYEKKLG
jgi:GNAT superfamily N-acetyltransferase